MTALKIADTSTRQRGRYIIKNPKYLKIICMEEKEKYIAGPEGGLIPG
jgi:hypothetical protein